MAGGGEATTTVEPVGYLKKPAKAITEWLQSQDLLNRPYPTTTPEQRFEPYTPEEQAARTMATDTLGSWRPFMGLGAANVAAPVDVNAFFNPFQETVVQNTLRDLDRQYQQQRGAEASRAFSQSSFGPEAGAAALPSLRAYGEEAGQTAGELRRTGFDTAVRAALQQQRQTQEAGRSLSQMASDVARLNAADIASLQEAGAYARQLPQAMKDFAYQEQWNKFNFPWNQAMQYARVLSALPQGQTQTQTYPGPSTAQQVVGGLSTAAGLGSSLYSLLSSPSSVDSLSGYAPYLQGPYASIAPSGGSEGLYGSLSTPFEW